MNHPYFPANARRRPLRRSSQLLPLEQRFMFDGAAVADAAHAAQAHDASVSAAAVPPAVLVRAAEPAKDEGKKEVVLVDTSLSNYKILEAGVRDGVGIVEFDGSRDGLAQIAAWAASQQGLDAIHILSHGSEGILNLGTNHLTSTALSSASVQAELAELGRALTADGDLLLYGCDVATGDGAALLAGLAKATGADVAASTDLTGAARLGGNWTLEAHTGEIGVHALALTQYDAALTLVSIVDADLPGAVYYQSLTKDLDGKTLTFTSPNMGYDAGDMLSIADAGLTGASELTISMQPGSAFDLTSFQMEAGSTVHLAITYADNTTASVDIAGPPSPVTIGSASFGGKSMSFITQIRITSADYVRLQDFNLAARSAPTTTVSSAALLQDTGNSNSDFITNVAGQTISGTLSTTLQSGEWVEVSYNDGASYTKATTYATNSASWSTTATLSGSDNFKVRVANMLGVATARTQAYQMDSTAPSTSITSASFSDDSGSSNTDFVTNVGTQTISGSLSANVAADETVYVSVNGSVWVAATAAVGQSTWSLAGVSLVANTNTLRVKVTDLAGNDGSIRNQAYTYDINAPTTTLSGLSLTVDSGTPGDFVTNTTAQTIGGTLNQTLASGEALFGSTDGGSSWTDLTSKVAGTTLTWTGATLLDNTTSSLRFKVIDLAGNTSGTTSRSYTVDSGTPATPAAPQLASASDTGPSNSDRVTSDNTPTFSGTAGAGVTVEIYDGITLLGSTVATGGVWSYTTGALGNASHSITAVAVDAAGNTSAASAATSITIDTSAPAVSSVGVPANGTYYTGDPLDFTVNYSEPVDVDTSGGTPRIAVTIGATVRYATYLSGSGSSALVFRYNVVNGDLDANGISVGLLDVNGGTLSDRAGNTGLTALNGLGSTAGIDVDGSLPSVTSVSASTANGSYAAGSTITITVSFNSALEIDLNGGSPTLLLNSGGTAHYLSGASGSNTMLFSYTVGAGENSADLDYSSTSALSLNGALLYESGGAGRNASLTLLTPGTAGSLGANKAIVIDTTAPTVISDSGNLSNDTGTSATDRITSVSAQDLQGTLSASLAAGDTVWVSPNSGASWYQAAISGGTNWKLAGQTLSVGTGAFLVKVLDAAGNQSPVASYSYTVDQSAPTLTFGGLALSADTGSSPGDFITNTSAQTVTATLSAALGAGDVVYGSLDNGAVWSNITSKVSGTTLSWNGVTLAGSDTLKLKVTDAAGNDGAVQSQAYTLDTTGPATTVASIVFSNDTGASNTDFITRTATQDISGTLSANLGADETVYVSLDNGASWQAASGTVGASGWTLANQTLVSSDTLQVKVSDIAGNDGGVRSQAYVYATSASVPTVDPLTTPSLTPVLSGSATLAAGDSMTVSVGGASYAVTPVAGTWTLDLASAVPASGALTLLLNTQYNVVATITDAAGNSSNDASAGELIVGTLAVPQTPPTTSIDGAALSSDSGVSNSDFITNVAQQTISGGLSAPLQSGESVQVSLDGGASWNSAAASGSSWSLNGTLSSSGTLLVRVSNDAGNGPVYRHAYTLDVAPPATPVADAQTSSSLTPVLGGAATLADGESLTVSVGGAEYAVSVSGGRWSLDLGSGTPRSGTLSLASGASYNVVASITDLAGNRSSASTTLTIAALPAVTGLTLSTDTGSSNSDFITNVAAQTVSGSLSAPLQAGQAVQVSVDGGATWQAASVSGNGSSWSASVTLSGSNTLAARVTSAAGNSAAFQQAYVLDTNAPTAVPSIVTQSTDGTVSGTLSAPLASGETVLVSRDGGASWTAISSGGQSWSLSLNDASSALVMVRDAAGNNGAALTVISLVEPPPPPVLAPGAVPAPGTPAAPGAPGIPGDTPAGPLTGSPIGEPGGPLAPPQTSLGGDIITSWPGQAPPTVIDTLPNFVALLPLPDKQLAPDNGFQIITLPALPGGDALVAYTPIPDVLSTSGASISVQIGSDAFAQSGNNANVTLSATSVDGKPLPGWLRFDGKTARFEGTPPLAFEGTLSFKVTARDSQGRMATQVFKIVVSKDGAKSGYWHSEPADPVGRASLGEQMRGARNSVAARLAALSS